MNITLTGVEGLRRSLADKASRLPQEMAVAINATAKATAQQMAKEVTKELATSQKVVKDTLKQTRKAVKSLLTAEVEMSKTSRPSLREFGARQTKAGVSARISKSRGRSVVPGAFQGPKPGAINAKWRGHVFKRVGKSRLPIVKLHGPSPWGVFTKTGATPRVVEFANKELQKQIQRRIRFNVLKSQGVI